MNPGHTKGTDMLESKECPDCKLVNEGLTRVGDYFAFGVRDLALQ